MHLEPFELHQPSTVEEAVRLAGALPGGADYIAGGTDLLPNYKMHLNPKPHLIALTGIPELRTIALPRVGAAVRLETIAADPAVAAAWPAVAEAAASIATPLVRASGTVGGNLMVDTRCFFFNQSRFWRHSLGGCLKADGTTCHVVPQGERCYATFSGDLAPALLVHGAQVELAGPSGRRTIPLSELYDAAGDGIRRHRLGPGEMVVAITADPLVPGERSTYRKLRVRPTFDFPELGVAVRALWRGPELAELRIAAGGLETYPRRFDAETAPLEGSAPGPAEIEALGTAIARSVRPVHNTSMAPDYRRRMTAVYVRRLVERTRPGASDGWGRLEPAASA